MTTEQVAAKAARHGLNLGLLLDGIIRLSDPPQEEAVQICKPYDAPAPDGKGMDAVLAVARGLTSDKDRLALAVRVICVARTDFREILSAHFASPSETSASVDDAKARALHAIQTGARKPAQIRAAAGLDEAAWPQVVAALESEGLIRGTGRGRGREYVVASAAPVDEPSDASSEPEATADGELSELAESAVDASIRDNVRDLLRPEALERSELVDRLADIEGISGADADIEVEALIREGFLLSNGGLVEWAPDQASLPDGGEHVYF
jgi:hypothetical protein